jgi:hypothetical protein
VRAQNAHDTTRHARLTSCNTTQQVGGDQVGTIGGHVPARGCASVRHRLFAPPHPFRSFRCPLGR